MNYKEFIKKNYKIIILFTLISLFIGCMFFRKLGIKDTIMIAIATFLLCSEMYLIKIDRKKSILLFMISLPILVFGRKICYFNFSCIKITYESIYISTLLLLNIKEFFSKIINYSIKTKGISKHFIILTILFIIFSINSSVFSTDISYSLSEVYLSILMPIVLMFFIIITFEKKDIKNIYYCNILAIDFSCLYGFSQIIFTRIPLKGISSNRGIITFGYHNINIFAGILMLVVPFVIQLILYGNNSKKEKIFLYFSITINIIALLITFTRGAWISFIIVWIILVTSKKYKKILYGTILVFAAFSTKLIPFIMSRGTNISFLKNESSIARIQSFFTSKQILSCFPLGVGGGNFAKMYKIYATKGYLSMPEPFRYSIVTANYSLESAHNLWLYIGVEFGIVCMIVFFAIIINRIIKLFVNYNDNRGAFATIISYLIFSVLTGVEYNHKGIITATLIIWIIFSIIEINSREGV
ncbi:hypothetical protein CF065_03230 [Clostridium sporogenes]|uniref:O-antigen ligase family protein n=2 Tax=Clostridium TaxID=1485 RepID=UPI002238FFD7|nr:O-antigen ligase family protein [Clostridium sporogenes]MCW6076431.1 O-antigen ligase family protein [Clostridium sporogenes]HDK7168284.1 O-antigen ligase family protein [Clostridium botulinum]